MNLFWNVLESSWGNILIVSNHKGLVRVTLPGDGVAKALNDLSKNRETILTNKNTPLIQLAKKQITEYLDGKRENFRLDLSPQGTEFQLSVWKALQKIPFGQTRSYQDIAKAIGNPKGMRAVGMANNKNPLPIVIPCHRVIGKNGALVGFGGGLPLKQKMLELEAAALPNLKSSKASTTSRQPHASL